MKKNRGASEGDRQKVKTRIGNQIRIADKKKTTSKNTKTEHENIFGRNEKSTTKVQLEETNQKVLTKEGRLITYQDRTKLYNQNKTFKNNERKFKQQLGENGRNQTNNWVRKEQKDFGTKYGNEKVITKKPNELTISVYKSTHSERE